jgi:type III secretion protein U
MAGKQEGADKTEKPTPKRLRDARKQGDIAKSKELTSTVVLLGWLAMYAMFTPSLIRRMEALFGLIFQSMNKPFLDVIGDVAAAALDVFLMLCLPLLIGAVLLAIGTEFLQVGSIFAPTKIKPDVNRLNPVEGVKRMFSQENIVEVLKAIFKTAVLVGLVTLVVLDQLNDYLKLPSAPVGMIGSTYSHATMVIGAWTIFAFLFVSVLDSAYQKFVYIKNMRMSRRDIRRELREDEGDPYIKSRRRQLHEEWATRNVLESVRKANVVVTNPTHVAVALLYEPGETLVPVVTAKGEDHLAKLIRETAEEAGVPIMQNIDLARGLYEHAEVDEYVPSEYFEAIAEVLRWADAMRKARDGEPVDAMPAVAHDGEEPATPGEETGGAPAADDGAPQER